MRRKDREITDPAKLQAIMDACKVCRIAMQDHNGLYLVPLNFGYAYEQGKYTLFFHSAAKGRKIDAMRQHPAVCFEMDGAHQLLAAEEACSYGYAFESIIGSGQVRFLTQADEKKRALQILMRHQTGKDFSFTDQMVEHVAVFALDVEQLCGKCHI